ncbi:alanine racemase [Rhodococcus opacus]|uniref:Alanine racemase n=1 Tax=Rhodococcus opacus TaxID=37919 RepID=A0A1B1K3I4_RHOOP|nr:alanine racemase [Rhodococcus opacus]ANS27174.1 Alanine racemase [Rhodococcus opacus]MCZ4582670.1 alanine racemase [Rhodococcus opacus]MDJ0414503.1 alanine racemase [Rhodococcus opacus]MDV6241121.1 alanine racemase [Rhodococcus opacus]WLF49819.1 alanine racemase [Rhodococcus opacus]
MTLAEAVPADDHGHSEPAAPAQAAPAPQAEAVVDLDAIAHNVRVLRDSARDAAMMAVVKADGYNHGAVPVARAALAAGASELGVTTVAEALTLRRAGIDAPVLAWLHTVDADFAPAIAAGVELGVSSPRHLAAVVAAARSVGTPAIVTIKVDTGLNRNGVAPDELAQVLVDLARAQAEGSVRLRGIFSHLAHADEPHHAWIDSQRDRLVSAIADAKRQGLVPEVVHLSNSAATLTRPDLRFDMVRPGIAIYGLSPVPELGQFGLRPAMTLRSRVALVKKVAAGEGVSYGHQWVAPRDTTVALLPFGYADGLPRSLSGRFEVQLGAERRPGIGRVCMDQVVVDLGPDGGGVREGDTAVFFGNGDLGEPIAQAWADELDTIHYEVVTGVRGRTVRSYVGGTGT